MAKKRSETETTEQTAETATATAESVPPTESFNGNPLLDTPAKKSRKKKSERNPTLRYYVAHVANDMTMGQPLSRHLTSRRAFKSLETLIGPAEVGIFKVVRVA